MNVYIRIYLRNLKLKSSIIKQTVFKKLFKLVFAKTSEDTYQAKGPKSHNRVPRYVTNEHPLNTLHSRLKPP